MADTSIGQSHRRISVRTKLAASLVAVALTMSWAVVVLADAGNPILGTIQATTTFNTGGTVTVSVRGEWNWLSHNTDCNFDRAGAGVAMIWNDPTETGYLLSKGSVSAQVGIKTKNGSWADPNPLDAMVHPVDRGKIPAPSQPGVTGQQFVDPTPPATGLPTAANATAWKGGCGREPLTATPFAGHPYGSWGYETFYSHTFRSASDITKVCANFYDVHGGGTVASGKFQLVNGFKEITVNQNGDNSIQTNAFNVNDGANCITVVPPATPAIVTTATNAVLPNGKISDSAVLSGANPGADIGDIVFKVYTTSDCSTGLVDTKTVTAVTGNGTYGSGDVTVTTAGTYYWQVSFISGNTGQGGNQDAIGICGDLAGSQHEQSVVTNLAYEKLVSTDNVNFSHSIIANPGDTLHYKIVITNTNSVAASGVTVVDHLSAALVSNSNDETALPGTCSPACTYSAPDITWTGIAVAANSTTTLTFSVTLHSSITGTQSLDNVVVSTTDNCTVGSTDPKCNTTTDVPRTLLSVSDKLIGVSGSGTVTYTAYGSLANCQAGTNGTSEGVLLAVTAGVAAASSTITVGPGGDFSPAVWWTATYTPNGGQPFTTQCSETASSS